LKIAVNHTGNSGYRAQAEAGVFGEYAVRLTTDETSEPFQNRQVAGVVMAGTSMECTSLRGSGAGEHDVDES